MMIARPHCLATLLALGLLIALAVTVLTNASHAGTNAFTLVVGAGAPTCQWPP